MIIYGADHTQQLEDEDLKDLYSVDWRSSFSGHCKEQLILKTMLL